MLTKTKIVLSALLVVGFASAALASDASEAASAQRSLFVQQTAKQPAGTRAYAAANGAVKPFTATERAQFERLSQPALSR